MVNRLYEKVDIYSAREAIQPLLTYLLILCWEAWGGYNVSWSSWCSKAWRSM